MNILFWICWIGEAGVVLWWIITDMQQKHMEPNPFSFLSFVYLLVVLMIRFIFEWTSVSNIMVMVPAFPLLGLLFIIIAHALSGKKWN